MTATTAPPTGGATAKGPRRSRTYFDEQGRRHTARILVPVNQMGELNGQPFKCRKCSEPFFLALNVKGIPVCDIHDLKMAPLSLKSPPLLPYRAIWDVCEKPLRPVWALPGMAAVGQAVDAGNVPALAIAGAVPLAFEVTRRAWRSRAVSKAVKKGDLEAGDDEYGKKLRAAIDAAARKAGYTAAAGTGWLAILAAMGLDPSTLAGKIAWTVALAPWLPAAATYWRKLREARKPKPVDPEADPEPTPDVDVDMLRALRTWNTVLAARIGEVIGRAQDGVTPVKATIAGKLPGTSLEDWHKVEGGWAATIVGPIGAYESDQFLNSIGKIASAYSVKKSMVTVIPDADDENRALVMLQKSSPIKESRRWEGPDSIDVVKGVAPVLTYADGEKAYYEIYRPGWGVPHVAAFGTTGSAKSEFLSAVFTIDRWAHYVTDDGRKVGIVADFLIDPQQGQSFAPFLDDLAGPVACSLEEAMVLVRALEREGLRRNRYLAREAKAWDERRQKWRTGRKWWNPLVDGPILALTIDEAHDYLSNREFAGIVTKAGRMWRKCGMQVRIATHTPLLTDLGGSMALRDMLTGGSVWMGRTANSLSGPTAFNGRLPVDPRSIPALPGMAYWLTGLAPKPMLARTDWEPDYYDWVRDDNDEPIGYPGVLPAETLAAFGDEYAAWVKHTQGDSGEPFVPAQATKLHRVVPTDAVLAALAGFDPDPADMDGLIGTLQRNGVEASIIEVRGALAELRGDGMVETVDGQHGLTEQGRDAMAELMGAAA